MALPSARRLCSALTVVCLVVGLAVGCGGDDAGSPSTTTTTVTREPGSALTEADIERLAQMLFANVQAGGAEVTITFEHGDGLNVSAAGVVDWSGHEGSLTVTSSGSAGQRDEEVRFTEDSVFEPLTPEAVAALAAAGRTGAEWSVRPPDPENRPIDQVIGLVVSLAASRPDNPALIAQRGLVYDGTEPVAGAAADRFSSTSAGATYWLDTETGLLVRFQGTLAGFASPIVVEMAGHGPIDVEVPVDAVPVDEIPT